MNKDNRIVLLELKNHLIKNFGDTVKDVILFGSRARGDSEKFSDYDVLIVLGDDYSGRDENAILDLCYDIDLKFDILLDVHIISEIELTTTRGKQPIFINAVKSGVYA
jgi:predicted nucleotidyltransferase